MYRFVIKKQLEGGYRFELGGIKMLVPDFILKEGKHILVNPDKAFAYFNINNSIYGLSNDPMKFQTAEALYDDISRQYRIFTTAEEPDYNIYTANNAGNNTGLA